MNIVVLDGYTENPGDISWEMLEKSGEIAQIMICHTGRDCADYDCTGIKTP